MKKRIFRILFLIIISGLLFFLNDGFKSVKNTVRAVGDLSVDWGVPEGDPIFVVSNIAPGQTETREVKVINNAASIRPVGVRGIKVSDTGSLTEKLNITISSGGNILYGGNKSLTAFFSESSGPDGIELININPGETKYIRFDVEFDPASGNVYQNTSAVFDLKIGIAIKIPDDCLGMEFNGDPIFGTSGNDRIRGTIGNDLIYGFEGSDRIESSNGDDCVIGGPGNDYINNSNGNDKIFGSDGNDFLYGSNGNDMILAGSGDDKIYSSNGDDYIYGEDGNDYIDANNGNDNIYAGSGNDSIFGSNGDDTIYSEDGNDLIYGGNGNDSLYGGSDNDLIRGGNNNDYIDGGDGLDQVYGELGNDSCLAEVKKSCEN